MIRRYIVYLLMFSVYVLSAMDKDVAHFYQEYANKTGIIQVYEAVVHFDRKTAQNIINNLNEYKRKDYYIPIPVTIKQADKQHGSIDKTITIHDYNQDPVYNPYKKRLEVWGYEYHWLTGQQQRKTKYEIDGVEQDDIANFFNKLPSLIGFEDMSKTVSTQFVVDSNYQERPQFFVNTTQQLIIYNQDQKYVCPFQYIAWDDEALLIKSTRGARAILMPDKKLYYQIRKAVENAINSTNKQPEVKEQEGEIASTTISHVQQQKDNDEMGEKRGDFAIGRKSEGEASSSDSEESDEVDLGKKKSSLSQSAFPNILLLFLTLLKRSGKHE